MTSRVSRWRTTSTASTTARNRHTSEPPGAGGRSALFLPAPVTRLALLVFATQVAGGLPPQEAQQDADAEDHAGHGEGDRVARGQVLEPVDEYPHGTTPAGAARC